MLVGKIICEQVLRCSDWVESLSEQPLEWNGFNFQAVGRVVGELQGRDEVLPREFGFLKYPCGSPEQVLGHRGLRDPSDLNSVLLIHQLFEVLK